MASPIPATRTTDIDVWTESTIESLSTLAISAAITSPRGPRGTAVTLDIPLDIEQPTKQEQKDADPALTAGATARAGYVRKRDLSRRDSLKSREALLKGKEGSRRRQKWENGACQLARYVV